MWLEQSVIFQFCLKFKNRFRTHVDTQLRSRTSVAVIMDLVHTFNKEEHNPWLDQRRSPRDLWIQTAISVALGASAFLAFCVSLLPLFTEAWLTCRRSSVRDGASSMLHGRDKKMQQRNSQNFQSQCLDGYQSFTELRVRRHLHLQGLMHMP